MSKDENVIVRESVIAPPLPRTGENTHLAIQKGYAGGMIIEPGDVVPEDVPVSTKWMREVSSPDRLHEEQQEIRRIAESEGY